MEGVTLDQLRALVAIVDEGSFSAAGRRLGRVQSAISHTIAALEGQLDLELFDRSTRRPTLTDAGVAMTREARGVLARVDRLRGVATHLGAGREARVSVVVDAVFPMEALVEACRRFQREMPTVALEVHTETLGAVSSMVLARRAQIGVSGPAAPAPDALVRQPLGTIRMVPVAAVAHPLAERAQRDGAVAPVDDAYFREHVQIVLSERSTDRAMPDIAVLSPLTWRVADLWTKRALLLAGLGWGNMPEGMVAGELAHRRLCVVRPSSWTADEHVLQLASVVRRYAPPGPAGRWLLAQLESLCD